MDFTNLKDPEVMRAVASLMNEALESPSGLHALAEAVAPPIYLDIQRKNIVPLVLTEHTLGVGQAAKYQKREELAAHYIAVGGQPHRQEVNADTEVEFPIFRVHSTPEVDISDLKHGNIGAITDMQTSASEAIRKLLNAKCAALLTAAAPAGNTVTVTGGKLTDDGFWEAVGKIEDLELQPRQILIRGSRMGDLKGWDLDDAGKAELRAKGVFKTLAGAGLINTASMATNTLIIVPDMEVGKYAIRTAIATDPRKDGFKVGFLTWHECAMGITRPDLVFKITITA